MTTTIRTSAAALLTPTGDWMDTPTHGVVRANGVAIASAQITPALAAAPRNGVPLRIMNEGTPIDLTITGINEPGMLEILKEGVRDVTATVTLHDGAPGAGYSANEIDDQNNPGYAPIPISLEAVDTP